jgi:hypothetical protein
MIRLRRRRRPVDPRRRRRRRWSALVVVLLFLIPVTSYVRALTYPGNAPFSVRSVEWVRDHGGGGIINAIENWRYSRQAPPAVGMPQDRVHQSGGGLAMPAARRAGLPAVQLLPGVAPLAGEGHWTADRRNGRTVLWTTWFRPDPRHVPVIAAAALIPRMADAIHLMPGTREPIPGMSSPVGYGVPVRALPDLVATFNSGFKLRDANGGWWTTWSHAVPLVDGRASIVIYWTDAHGNLVYVAGHGMTLATFARAMRAAGIEQGMELDIHPFMVSFNLELQGTDGGIISHRLLDSMNTPADRYLSADQRDFFYVTAKP